MVAAMSQPLTGVRVVSLAVNLPGPLAAARLAELGAAVTKAEPPQGDPLAHAAPGWYRQLVERQSVVTLDLKTANGRAGLDALLSDADLLITSMRPSALRRLGLDRLRERHPKLSLVEIVGHDGDQAEEPGHDLNYQAVHGTLSPPHLPKVPVADLLGAERAVSAGLAALVSGGGGIHRVVLEEAAARAGDAVRFGLLGDGAPLGGALPAYGLYPCADGYIALGAIEPHFFRRVLKTFGVDGSHESLRAAFAGRTIAELEALAADHDIPLNGVR